ncbi:MAG: hypothetical protein KBB91_00260 [Candidatus Pacebacteria bacterium]|jgi:hypothetical protein|nr:hypothetical protein [Candidatus Paceibacterota bacterium]
MKNKKYVLHFKLAFPSKGITSKFNGITPNFDFITEHESVGSVTNNDYLLHKKKLVITSTKDFSQLDTLDTSFSQAIWSSTVDFLKGAFAPDYSKKLHFAGYLNVRESQVKDLPRIKYEVYYGSQLVCYIVDEK